MPAISWRRLLVAGGFVLVYLYTFPFFAGLHSANEMPRVYLAEEIARSATFKLDARRAELARGSLFDVATTCGRPPRALTCSDCPHPGACYDPDPLICRCADQHLYPNKAPGASFMAVPAALVLRAVAGVNGTPVSESATVWWLRFSAVTVPALLFLPFFLGMARRFAPEPTPSRAALVAYALGSMALPYALLLFSHQIAAVGAAGAFVVSVRLARAEARRPCITALIAGALSALAVLADYQSALAVVAIGVYLAVRSRRRVRDLGFAALGAAPLAVLLAVYHWSCFGAPWRTGYAFARDPAHSLGVMGVVGPNRAAMWQSLLAPDNGLLVLMPWVLLAVVGAVAIARDATARARIGAEAVVCAAVLVAYIVFVGSLTLEFSRAGWSVGPRYITVALPFAAWLAAAGLQAADCRAPLRAAAHALILVGVVVFVVATTTYPHWPTAFANPLYEVSFRALREGLVPPSLGTAVGLHGLLSLLPLHAATAALTVGLFGPQRGRLLTTAVAALLAAGIIVAYSRFPAHTPEAKWQNVVRTWSDR